MILCVTSSIYYRNLCLRYKLYSDYVSRHELVIVDSTSYALAMAISGKPDTALTSDPVYPATLIPGSFSPGRGY